MTNLFWLWLTRMFAARRQRQVLEESPYLGPATVSRRHFLGAAMLAPLALMLKPVVQSSELILLPEPQRIIVNDGITRCYVQHLTPAQLEALFRPNGLFEDMDAWFRTSFEMQACGVKDRGLYDLLDEQWPLSH